MSQPQPDLISRLEELQVQPKAVLQRFGALYTLSDAADMEEAAAANETEGAPALAGLHAKLYVSDVGDRAHIWTGSANATHAGFARNVEFLVELSGPRASCGVDAVDGAVLAEGVHLCSVMRGVNKANAKTITSAMRGVFRSDPKTRAEFVGHVDRTHDRE